MAEISGYSVEEIIDRLGPKDLVHPEDWPTVAENIRKRMDGELNTIQYETRSLSKNKEVVYLEVFGSKTIYQGKPAIIGTFADITDRKTIEDQLQQSRKIEAVGRLPANY